VAAYAVKETTIHTFSCRNVTFNCTYLEYVDSMFLQNVRKNLPVYTASPTKRRQSQWQVLSKVSNCAFTQEEIKRRIWTATKTKHEQMRYYFFPLCMEWGNLNVYFLQSRQTEVNHCCLTEWIWKYWSKIKTVILLTPWRILLWDPNI